MKNKNKTPLIGSVFIVFISMLSGLFNFDPEKVDAANYYYDKYQVSLNGFYLDTEKTNAIPVYHKYIRGFYQEDSIYDTPPYDFYYYRDVHSRLGGTNYITGYNPEDGRFGMTYKYDKKDDEYGAYVIRYLGNGNLYVDGKYYSNLKISYGFHEGKGRIFVYEISGNPPKTKGSLLTPDIIAAEGTYPDDGVHTDGYWYVKKAKLYNPPTFNLQLSGNVSINQTGTFSIAGTLTDDVDNDKTTVSATVAGVTKTTVISNTASNKNWTLSWSGGELPQGQYNNIRVYAVDTSSGSASDVYKGTLTVDKTSPVIGSIQGAQQLNNPSRGSFRVTVYNVSDSGGAGLNRVDYWSRKDTEGSYTYHGSGIMSGANNYFDVPSRGEGTYYIDARAYDGAGNVVGPVSTYVTLDGTAPTASHTAVYFKGTSISTAVVPYSDGSYDVYAYNVADALTGISNVRFPTWTTKNGQDDLIWHDGINLGNGTWMYNVKFSEHNHELGEYITHIYAYDGVGNNSAIGAHNVFVNQNPSLTVNSVDQVVSAVNGYEQINITGTASDPDGHNITVSASVGGVNKSVRVASGGTWTLSWNVSNDDIVQGVYQNFAINASDDFGGSGTLSYSGKITVDRTSPEGTIPPSTTDVVEELVLNVQGSDTGGAGFKRIKLPNGTFVNGDAATYPVLQNGTYTFVFEDNVGNIDTKTITVSNINKKPVLGELISVDKTKAGNKDIIRISGVATDEDGEALQVSGQLGGVSKSALSNPADGEWVIEFPAKEVGEGEYTQLQITVRDTYWSDNKTYNFTKLTVDITDPFFWSVSQTPKVPTNGNVDIQVNVADAYTGVKRIKLPNGTYVTGKTNAVYTVTDNGPYAFEVEDVVGNSVSYKVEVTNINRTAPVLTAFNMVEHENGTFDVYVQTEDYQQIQSVTLNTGQTLSFDKDLKKFVVKNLATKPVSITVEDKAGNQLQNQTFIEAPSINFPSNYSSNVTMRDDVVLSVDGTGNLSYKTGVKNHICSTKPCDVTVTKNKIISVTNSDDIKSYTKSISIQNINKTIQTVVISGFRNETNPNIITLNWNTLLESPKLTCLNNGPDVAFTPTGQTHTFTGENKNYECYVEGTYDGKPVKSNTVSIYVDYKSPTSTTDPSSGFPTIDFKKNVYEETTIMGKTYYVNLNRDNTSGNATIPNALTR